MGKKNKQEEIQRRKILVLGFEKIGFDIKNESVFYHNDFEIKFIQINSTKCLDIAEGVIIPNGIFEEFKIDRSSYGTNTNVIYYNDLILQREREILNLFESNGWVCFLVRSIIDKVLCEFEYRKCEDTDLVKKYLNALSIDRDIFKGSSVVKSKNDAFNNYIKTWGIAKTKFKLCDDGKDKKILATCGDNVVGFEYYGKVFFLPFHTNRTDQDEAIAVIGKIVDAVSSYLLKRRYEVPTWCSEFVFKEEEKKIIKLDKFVAETKKIQQDLEKYKRYKGMLFQSGEILKDTIVNILKKFFLLNVDEIEDFIEDATIRDDQNNILAVVEIKGINKGIKREHINQVDSHRERLDLSTEVPGLLVINDFMKIDGIENRVNALVDSSHIKHAKNFNVLILRSIDLLFIMRHLEDCINPGKILIQYCNQGGGRLYYNENDIKLDIGDN